MLLVFKTQKSNETTLISNSQVPDFKLHYVNLLFIFQVSANSSAHFDEHEMGGGGGGGDPDISNVLQTM